MEKFFCSHIVALRSALRAQSRLISFEVEAAAEKELIEMSPACLSSSLLVKLETCQHIDNMHTKALAEAVRSCHSDNLNSYFVQVTLIVKGIMPSTREDKQAVNQSIWWSSDFCYFCSCFWVVLATSIEPCHSGHAEGGLSGICTGEGQKYNINMYKGIEWY